MAFYVYICQNDDNQFREISEMRSSVTPSMSLIFRQTLLHFTTGFTDFE